MGGTADDYGLAIAVDQDNNAYVTGAIFGTGSNNFGMAGSYHSGVYDGCDTFVSKINAAGTDLIYSTYLGLRCESCTI